MKNNIIIYSLLQTSLRAQANTRGMGTNNIQKDMCQIKAAW